jgi:hypothetical protein
MARILMDKAEYWLLSSVIEDRLPLRLLVSSDLELHLNRRGHGLPYLDLINTLHRLFERGDLIAHYMSRYPGELLDSDERPVFEQVGDYFTPSRQEIEAGVRGAAPIYYGLTRQGGSRWEGISNPNWNRYLDDSYYFPQRAEIISANRGLIETLYAHQAELGWVPVTGTEVWDVVSPWRVTYWKTLSMAHRLQFQWHERELPRNLFAPELHDWLRVIRRWYTDPLEENNERN